MSCARCSIDKRKCEGGLTPSSPNGSDPEDQGCISDDPQPIQVEESQTPTRNLAPDLPDHIPIVLQVRDHTISLTQPGEDNSQSSSSLPKDISAKIKRMQDLWMQDGIDHRVIYRLMSDLAVFLGDDILVELIRSNPRIQAALYDEIQARREQGLSLHGTDSSPSQV